MTAAGPDGSVWTSTAAVLHLHQHAAADADNDQVDRHRLAATIRSYIAALEVVTEAHAALLDAGSSP